MIRILALDVAGLVRINGNDALSLQCNGVKVDRVGSFDAPSDGWTVSEATVDSVLMPGMRSPSTVLGNGGDWSVMLHMLVIFDEQDHELMVQCMQHLSLIHI